MNEWIKCAYRFPEEGIDVLVWDGNRGIDINTAKYEIASYRAFANGKFFISAPYILQNITHWMPLPNPPEKQDS